MPVTSKALGIATTSYSLPFRWKWETRRISSKPLTTFHTLIYGLIISYSALDFGFTGVMLIHVVITSWPILKSERLAQATSLFAVLGPKLACLACSYTWIVKRNEVVALFNQILLLRYRGKVYHSEEMANWYKR